MVVESYTNEDGILDKCLTLEEVNIVCNELKCNKAPGWDDITAEHVKYGGRKLLNCLLRLFNCISKYE